MRAQNLHCTFSVVFSTSMEIIIKNDYRKMCRTKIEIFQYM